MHGMISTKMVHPSRGRAGARGVADGIAFGVLDPEILSRADQPFWYVVADSPGKRVVTGGADFVIGPDDHAADLRIGVLAAACHHLADLKIVLIPTGYRSHWFPCIL